MRWNIASPPLTVALPYELQIHNASTITDTPTALLYAIAWHETISGEVSGQWTASSVISADGGHGLCQLTASWPDNWDDAQANAVYACKNFIIPDALYWYRKYGYTGETLVRCIAASYNAGISGAEAGHIIGNVDCYTTNRYAAKVLGFYRSIVATGKPA